VKWGHNDELRIDKGFERAVVAYFKKLTLNEGNHENSVWLADKQAEIQTRYVLDTNADRYRYTKFPSLVFDSMDYQ
jgi:hypothetical protein